MIAPSGWDSLHFLVCLLLNPKDQPHPTPLSPAPEFTPDQGRLWLPDQGFEAPFMPPWGLPAHKPATWCSFSEQALHTLLAGPWLSLSSGPACLLSLPGCRARGTRLLVMT